MSEYLASIVIAMGILGVIAFAVLSGYLGGYRHGRESMDRRDNGKPARGFPRHPRGVAR